MAKSTVYFTKEITPEAVLKMYRQLGVELPGKVAVKVHSGEDGNQNFLRPEFMKPVIDAVHGTVVECNTAYGGARNETPKHGVQGLGCFYRPCFCGESGGAMYRRPAGAGPPDGYHRGCADLRVQAARTAPCGAGIFCFLCG